MSRTSNLTSLTALAICALCVAGSAVAGDARRTEAITSSAHATGLTPAALAYFLGVHSTKRLHDLEVEQADPPEFAAVLVENSNANFENGTSWAYHQTEAQLRAAVTANQARLIDVERYLVSGAVRFAGVMVGNTGPYQRDTWFYVDKTAAEIGTLLNQNDARLIDLETYVVSGTRLYTCLMVRNTGAEATGWWWLLGETEASLNAFQSSNNARLYSVETYLESGSRRFNAILVPNTGTWAARQWWFFDQPASALDGLCAQYGARIGDLEAYNVLVGLTVQTRYAVTLTNNESGFVQRIGDVLGYGSDGVTGFQLKRVNGAVVGGLNDDYESEPASALKIFHELHVMRRVQQGLDGLDDPYFVGNGYIATGSSCPTGGSPYLYLPLRKVVWLMMMNSDNAATQFVRSHFGMDSINATAATWGGVLNSAVGHTIGCGEEAVVSPGRFTPADMCRIYENIARASAISPQWRDTLFSYMAGPGSSMETHLRDIAAEEGASLGLSPGVLAAFQSGIAVRYKPGGYGLDPFPNDPGRGYFARAGWARLPQCGVSGGVEYGFGAFVNLALDQNGAAIRVANACREMFREEIRAALQGCLVDAPLEANAPNGVTLASPAPNPFGADGATLRFALPIATGVRLSIVDVTGRRVATLVERVLDPGEHAARWDARDAAGVAAPAGVYFARLEAAGSRKQQKLIVRR